MRQANGVIVEVGTGEGVEVTVEAAMNGTSVCVAVGMGWLIGVQAVIVVKSASSIEIAFVRRIASLVA